MDIHERLRLARKQAGFRSAAAAAKHFGWGYSTYAAHENGQNDLHRKAVERYSEAFNVSTSWLLTGDDASGHAARLVPVVGTVAEAGAVCINDIECISRNEKQEFAPAPPGGSPTLLALKILDDSNKPILYKGDIVYYDPEDMHDAHELAGGKECIVILSDGRTLLKRITEIAPGRFGLIDHNSDPILDAQIVGATRVRFIARAD